MSSEYPYPYDKYKGHFVVRGMKIPLIYGAGSYKIEAVEVLQVSGTPLDRAVFGLSFRIDEVSKNLSDSPVFGDTTLQSENLKNNLSDSPIFGDTDFESENLKNNLSESVVITNE